MNHHVQHLPNVLLYIQQLFSVLLLAQSGGRMNKPSCV